jgi:hypothetical protein
MVVFAALPTGAGSSATLLANQLGVRVVRRVRA